MFASESRVFVAFTNSPEPETRMPPDEPEQWLGLPWAKGYEVSSHGRVRSYLNPGNPWNRALRTEPSPISTRPHRGGYCQVNLRSNGTIIRRRVHVLVLEAFAGFRPEGMVGRHLDGVKSNCRISNLQWGTHKDNFDDARQHGVQPIQGSKHSQAKLTESAILEIIRLHRLGRGVTELARMFGVSHCSMSRIVSRQRWRHVSA